MDSHVRNEIARRIPCLPEGCSGPLTVLDRAPSPAPQYVRVCTSRYWLCRRESCPEFDPSAVSWLSGP